MNKQMNDSKPWHHIWASLGSPLQLWLFIASYSAYVPASDLSSSAVSWVSLPTSSSSRLLMTHESQVAEHIPRL